MSDPRIVECSDCGGDGRDPFEWDGRCVYCDGKGDRICDWSPDDDEGCGDPECCS